MRELIDEINASTARLRELSDEMSREREERADDMDAGPAAAAPLLPGARAGEASAQGGAGPVSGR
jgi:hypothetical protein